jgi:phosphoribosylamine--glycine ligase
MKVLVLGSGGREHALAWKLSQEKNVSGVFLHPGNAGTWASGLPTLEDVPLSNLPALTTAAQRQGVELIVIGPEVLLSKGYADHFREAGFLVVGPGTQGAQLETSKYFAKKFLEAGGIPTAAYEKVSSPDAVRNHASHLPKVLKLDGLAAGKGVVVATQNADVENFIQRVWGEQEFGPGPHTIVVESFLPGKELSYIGLCDGHHFIALSSASDYKRIGEGNTGPNTGGMGAISPSPLMTPELEKRIQERIVAPTLKQLQTQGIEYRGALYFGLMISPEGEPFVLEFNARFGDPETQALLLRLGPDLLSLLVATAKGELEKAQAPSWKEACSVYVVASAEGYPAQPRVGDAIEGENSLEANAVLFFSGVSKGSKGLVTQGGRVLGVGAVGADAESCREKAYEGLSRIQWKGKYCRRDIGLFT